jgi:hypothetical protein
MIEKNLELYFPSIPVQCDFHPEYTLPPEDRLDARVMPVKPEVLFWFFFLFLLFCA